MSKKSPKIKRPKNWVGYDLACGNNKGGGQPGFIGVDITKKGTQADIEWDLMKFPWEFAKDDSVDEVFCSHFLEHVKHGDGYNDPFYQFFDELYRILKPGGIARFVCPYYSSVRAIQDPTHMRSIGEPTFFYLSKKWRELNKLTHYPITCDFETIKIDHAVSEEMNGKAQDAVAYQAMHFWNIVSDISIVIQKSKLK